MKQSVKILRNRQHLCDLQRFLLASQDSHTHVAIVLVASARRKRVPPCPHRLMLTARILYCCNAYVVQVTATALQPPSPMPRRLVWAREAGRVAALRGGASLSAAPLRAIGGRLVSSLRMSGGLLTSGAIIGGANLLGLGITLFSGVCEHLHDSYPKSSELSSSPQYAAFASALGSRCGVFVHGEKSSQTSPLICASGHGES